MAHPFAKILEKALAKSTPLENLVTKEANKILEKGYRKEEICVVLQKLGKGRIDDNETAIVQDAFRKLCGEDSGLADD